MIMDDLNTLGVNLFSVDTTESFQLREKTIVYSS